MNNDIQSAEEFARSLAAHGTINCGREDCKACPEHLKAWVKDIEADRAAQRQAGREDMREILTEAMEAMAERRCYLDIWEWKYGERWNREDSAIRKALSDLDEARKGCE